MLTAVNGLLGPAAGLVNGPGQQVLAGAAFTGDQDRHVAGGMQLGLLEQPPHGRRAGQNGTKGPGAAQLE